MRCRRDSSWGATVWLIHRRQEVLGQACAAEERHNPAVGDHHNLPSLCRSQVVGEAVEVAVAVAARSRRCVVEAVVSFQEDPGAGHD